jgi:hypothetical protein
MVHLPQGGRAHHVYIKTTVHERVPLVVLNYGVGVHYYLHVHQLARVHY